MKDSEAMCIQVDANAILRYVAKDHPDHFRKAQVVFSRMEEGTCILECDPVTLGEVVWTLGSFYKVSNAYIAEGLAPIVQSPGFRIPNKDRYLHALALFAGSVKSFGDACCCAAAVERCGGRLFSFDPALTSVPGVERLEEV